MHRNTEVRLQLGGHAWLMYLQIALCGAIVMLVEILGTRIIGPVFGTALFVWSALLATTLSALALGYVLGGRLADHTAKHDWLSWVMFGAGITLAAEPYIRVATLSFSDQFGLKVGPIIASLVLFFPTLCLLGMTGPIAIQRSVHDLSVTGRRVGWIYALSTIGSLVGTFAVGFYLVPAFPINGLLTGASALLLSSSVIPLLLTRSRYAAFTLIAILPALVKAPLRPLPEGFTLVDRSESLLGLVEVIDDAERNVRFLRMDHSIIGAQFRDTHAGGFAFQHIIETLRFARPSVQTFLQIGLGAGSVPTALRQQGKIADVVEIDPVIVKMAEEHFGFGTMGKIVAEDARAFLRKSVKTYGIIVHDTFSGGSSPEHLFSREMLALIKLRLNPGGLLVLNFVGFSAGPNVEAALAVRNTMLAQFAHVHAFRDSPSRQPLEELGNIVYFASDSPVVFDIPSDATFESPECGEIARSFLNWEVFDHVPPGAEIKDSHNPLTRMQSAIVTAHYEGMKQLLPENVWIR